MNILPLYYLINYHAFLSEAISKLQKNYAYSEIWTHAGLPPADLESAALDRSAMHAVIEYLIYFLSYKEDLEM